MKKQIITLIAVAGITAGATMAYAAAGSAGGGIVGSKHDMNNFNGLGTKDAQGRVCAYCHTPHHAEDTKLTADTISFDALGDPLTATTYTLYSPLWSRSAPSTGLSEYISATFNPRADGKFYDPMAGPSRLCMSCHDGNTAVDAYYGQTVSSQSDFGTDDLTMGGTNFAIGGNHGLMNDHPVGFVYNDMANDHVKYEINDSSKTFSGGKTIDSALTSVAELNGKVMSCASCHDVHNGNDVQNRPADKRGYFLLGKQAGSELCLTCHNKNAAVL